MSAPVPDAGDVSPPPGAEAAAAGGAAAPAAAGGKQKRRLRPDQVHETIDELATEERRTSLLDLIEGQLKSKETVSRIFFVFPVADDANVRTNVEAEFNGWLRKEEKERSVTGLLLFQGQAGVSFLEGPTEDLFAALAFFDGMASDDGKAALIGALRVLYQTEVHGVRTTPAWCTIQQQGKPMGGNAVMERDNSSESAFMMYRKFLLLNLEAAELLSDDDGSANIAAAMKTAVKKIVDKGEMLPTMDEIALFLSKSALEYFFTYAEFEKIFVAPFHTVLHSELLWPMPPPLSY